MKPIELRPGSTLVVGVFDFARALGQQALLQVGQVVLKLLDDQPHGELDLTTAEVVEPGKLNGHPVKVGDKVCFLRDGPFPRKPGSVYKLTRQVP